MSLLNRTFALALAWALATATYAQPPQAEGGGVRVKAGTFMLTTARETPWISGSGEQGTLPCGVMVMILGSETTTQGRFRIPEREGDVRIEGKYLMRMPEDLQTAWLKAQQEGAKIPELLLAASVLHLGEADRLTQMRKLSFQSEFQSMVKAGDIENALKALNAKVSEFDEAVGRGHLLALILQSDAFNALAGRGLAVQSLSSNMLSAARTYFFKGDAIRTEIALAVANELSRSGAVQEALEIVDAELPDSIGGHPRLVLPWVSVSTEIFTRAGRSGKALSLRRQILGQLMEQDHSDYRNQWYPFLNLTARAYRDVGNIETAKQLYEVILQQLQFPEKTEEKFSTIAAVAADNLAEILADQGQFERALELNAAAIRIFIDLGEQFEGSLATSRQIRSRMIFTAIQNKTEASRVSEMLEINGKAVNYFIQAAGKQASEKLAACLHLRGEMTQFLGSVMATDSSRHEQAKSLFQESQTVLRIAMNQRAELTGSLGVFPAFNSVNRFTESAVQVGNIKEAVEMSVGAAMQRVEDILTRAAFSTHEESLEIFGGATQELLARSVSLGLENPQMRVLALSNLLNYKARQTESRAAAYSLGYRTDSLTSEKSRTQSRDVLQYLRMLNAAESAVAYRSVENREIWHAVGSTETRESFVRLQDLYGTNALAKQLQIVELKALLESIPKDSVFVDYTITHPLMDNNLGGKKFIEGYFTAIVYAPDGQGVRIVLLAPVRGVVPAVERLRNACRLEAIEQAGDPATAAKDALSAARQLSAMIWDPIAKGLGDAKHLIISPEAELWFVPWAALPGNSSDFLVEERRISLVMSGRELAVAPPALAEHEAKAAAVVLAAPNFNADQSKAWRDLRGTELPSENLIETVGRQQQIKQVQQLAEQVRTSESILPPAQALANARPEAEAIVAPLRRISGRDPILWTGDAALEPAIAEHTDSPQVLVFITHGFALGSDSPETAARTSSGSEQRSVPQPIRTGSQNPLVNCGLLLAGCNARGNMTGMWDGILTGQEVLGMNLRQTELVVLSACETGLGTLQGSEGVAGLRQAFQLAGARSVLATLWTVDDLENKNLMVDFFDSYADSRDAAAALRSAQLKRIADLKDQWGAAHPYFWAAATVTGPPQREN